MHNNMHIIPLITFILLTNLIIITSTIAAAADTFNISKAPTITKSPNCPSTCGDLLVPYPFGVGRSPGCGVTPSFELNCSHAFDPPRLFISGHRVIEITDDHVRISNVVARRCFDTSGAVVQRNSAFSYISGTPFSYSDLNKFNIVGCDDFSVVLGGGGGRSFSGGCC